MKLFVLLLMIQLLWVACGSSHPPPQTPPNPAPPPPKVPEIPEVVKNEMDLLGDKNAGCELYTEAAERIWGYRVQADLDLSLQIYEGRIVAGDAERLIEYMDQFSNGWKMRFSKFCEHQENEMLAPDQYGDGTICMKELLDVQKDYVNGLFFEKAFTLEAAAKVAARLSECDDRLTPKGAKALMDNPF